MKSSRSELVSTRRSIVLILLSSKDSLVTRIGYCLPCKQLVTNTLAYCGKVLEGKKFFPRVGEWTRDICIHFPSLYHWATAASIDKKQFYAGNTNERGRLCTLDLLSKVACFDKEVSIVSVFKSSLFKLVSTRRSMVLILPLQWGSLVLWHRSPDVK